MPWCLLETMINEEYTNGLETLAGHNSWRLLGFWSAIQHDGHVGTWARTQKLETAQVLDNQAGCFPNKATATSSIVCRTLN